MLKGTSEICCHPAAPHLNDIRLFLNKNQNERNNYVLKKIKDNIIKVIELSDNIRDSLSKIGFTIKDGREGTTFERN